MRLVIHPGYPKTATSYLQNKIFPYLKEYRYLGRSFTGVLHPTLNMSSAAIQEVFVKELLNSQESEFNSNVDYLANLLVNDLSGCIDGKYLLSLEGIQNRGFVKEAGPVLNRKGSTDVILQQVRLLIDRLEKLIGPIQVDFVITIREQKEIVSSLYSYFYNLLKDQSEYFEKIDTFRKFVDAGLSHPDEYFFGSLFYHTELEKYENFPGSTVKVMLYEDFERDSGLWLEELFDFLQTSSKSTEFTDRTRLAESGNSESKVYIDRSSTYEFLHYIYMSIPNEVRTFIPHWLRKRTVSFASTEHELAFEESQTIAMDNLYRASNKITSLKYQLDMARHGYALE